MPEFIQTSEANGVFTILINRPEKRNAMNSDMLLQLSDAYTEFENNLNAKVAIVKASGKSFTLGLELSEVMEFIQKNRGFPIPSSNVDPWGLIGRQRTKPVICVVHGMCMTLGIELMLAADIGIAAASTIFGQIETTRGIFPFGGGIMRWIERVGRGNAMKYIITGETLNAEEAYQLGLVQYITEKKHLEEQSLEIAGKIMKQAPLAVKYTLAIANDYERYGIQKAIESCQSGIEALLETEDLQEGVNSFLQNREGSFRGK
ncbi:MAG: crotonase/enoyl-CoA hydratase family protein [Spirochaetota bacterium]